MNKQTVLIVCAVLGLIVAGLDLFVVPEGDPTVIVVLTFFTMLAQGCIALAAVAQLSKGIWLIPIRRDLLGSYPMLFVLALLYLLLWKRMDIYPWMETTTVWLEPKFFIIRNVVLLLLCWVLGRGLAKAVARGSESASKIAFWYVFAWVVSQSLIAFDWIMSLEYPWISTLFGAFFFIQSLLMGLLVSSFIIFFRKRAGDSGLTETLRDTSKMIFAFCFMWAGFFYAQYLVIWYGNIPEEVAYILKRVDPSPYWGLSRAMLAMIFVIPFLSLIFEKVKVIPLYVITVALIIFSGMIIELLIMVTPVASVAPVWMIAEFALVLVAFLVLMNNRHLFVPQAVKTADVPGGGH